MSLSQIQTSLRERLSPIRVLPDGTYQASITFDRAFPGFDGRFPDNPIVPGVCEISIVELLARMATGNDALRTNRIVQVKFRAPLLPNDCATFLFTLRKDEEGQTIISATASTPEKEKIATIKLALCNDSEPLFSTEHTEHTDANCRERQFAGGILRET